jgi:hypothetical protein
MLAGRSRHFSYQETLPIAKRTHGDIFSFWMLAVIWWSCLGMSRAGNTFLRMMIDGNDLSCIVLDLMASGHRRLQPSVQD